MDASPEHFRSPRLPFTAQSPECAVFTKDRQKLTTPDDAIARLKAGNERFTAEKSVNCDLMAQVKQTAGDQAPYAAIVGCIDSRVPPELVFDQHIGDVFCARVAGNIVDTDIHRQPRIFDEGRGRQGDRRPGR